jgi:hypothetical protein
MNIKDVKQIRLVEYLGSIGHQPVKVRGISYWYLSPLRNERTASFKVNDYLNEWYDFGIAQGGDIIDLAKLLFNTQYIPDILERLCNGASVPPTMRIHKRTEILESMREKMREVEILPLHHHALLSYLQSRSIDQELGRMYCREIHYVYYHKKYFAIAFQNRSNGYEIRNTYFKGCIYNKDISVLHYKPGERQAECCVFEGFMDFLSFMTIRKTRHDYRMEVVGPCDYIVLNSVSNISKALTVLEKYDDIHCFLDNDAAGSKATELIKRVHPLSTIDERFRYGDCKDLNDYLIGRKK